MTPTTISNVWRDQRAVGLSVAAVIVALLIGLSLVAAIGVPLHDAIAAFTDGAWGTSYAVAASINRSVTTF